MDVFEQLKANQLKQQQDNKDKRTKDINYLVSLVDNILSKKDKLDHLIKLGQACVDSGTMVNYFEAYIRGSYNENNFIANGWSHHLGFIKTQPNSKTLQNLLCVCGGGACGPYDLSYSNGKLYLSSEKNYYENKLSITITKDKLTELYDYGEFKRNFHNYNYEFDNIKWLLEVFNKGIEKFETRLNKAIEDTTKKLGA